MTEVALPSTQLSTLRFLACRQLSTIFEAAQVQLVEGLLVWVARYFAQIAMEVASHLAGLKPYIKRQRFALLKAVEGVYSLLRYLPDLLFNIFLIELNYGGRTVFAVCFFCMQDFQSSPSCAPRVDLALISRAKESHFFLSKPLVEGSFLILIQLNCFSYPFHHVLIPFSLFCHSSHIECFLAHYIFQMQECENGTCKKRIIALQQLLQKQSQTHTAEIRKIEESLQEFANAKKQECCNYQTILEKMTCKLDKYKAKCCTLNEKTKEYVETIKALNGRILALEEALKTSKEESQREKGIGIEHLRINSELRQVIALQQAENKQLNLRVRLYQQEIESLQAQLALKSINEVKLKNAEYVSEQQYHRQANLLRQNLKLEFNRSTDQLLSTLPKSGFNFTTEEKQLTQQQFSQAEEELRMLANFTDYGPSFLSTSTQNQVFLPASKKIYSFFKELSLKNDSLHQEIEELQQVRDQLTEQMRSKLIQIQELVAIQQIQTFEVATQTPNNDAIEKLSSINGIYRIKIIEFQQIMNYLVYFGAYSYHLARYQQKKISYFKKAAHGKLQFPQKGSKNLFKSIALSILFIEILKKKGRKAFSRASKINKTSLDNMILQRMVIRCLSEKQQYNRKNPILEQLTREKATVTKEGTTKNFMNLISEQAIGLSLSKFYPFNSSHYDITFF